MQQVQQYPTYPPKSSPKLSKQEKRLKYYAEKQTNLLTASAIIFGLIGSSASLTSNSNLSSKILIVSSLGILAVLFAVFFIAGSDYNPYLSYKKRNPPQTLQMTTREYKSKVEADYVKQMNFAFSVFLSVATFVFVVGISLAIL